MSKPLRSLIVLAVVLAIGIVAGSVLRGRRTASDPAVVAASPQVHQLADANILFGFRLLAHLTKAAPRSNVFFSPFSVTNALTMILNGAAGTTQRDIASTLSLQAMSLDQTNQASSLLLPSLENPNPKVELSVANALWANKGQNFAPDFQSKCRRFYGAEATTLDFSKPSAASTINRWVSRNTRGKIDSIVSADDLSSSTAVLTNAVYFHGQWTKKFNKQATQNGKFTLAGGQTKIVPLMTQEDTFSYLETNQFQAVSLPYGQGRISAYVFLPRKNLHAFLSSLNAAQWQEWIGKMRPTSVTITLPRFGADYHASLNAPLTALGMGSTFGPGADFAPMGLNESFIGKIVHKAVLQIDEEGTVAAAATGGEMTASVRPLGVEMRVDHPFFLAIRDNLTGTLLFVGAIYDPK